MALVVSGHESLHWGHEGGRSEGGKKDQEEEKGFHESLLREAQWPCND